MAETAGAHPGGSSSERDALLRTKLQVPRLRPGLVPRRMMTPNPREISRRLMTRDTFNPAPAGSS
jgi:hypothetical protein